MNDSIKNRENILELLGLISSKKELLDYESNVPHVDITVELVSMWFDDEYKSEQEQNIKACFSNKEIIALNEFHEFYLFNLPNLPKSKGTVQTWLNNSSWQSIMEKAKVTRAKIKA